MAHGGKQPLIGLDMPEFAHLRRARVAKAGWPAGEGA